MIELLTVLGILAAIVIAFVSIIHLGYRIPREPYAKTPDDYDWVYESLNIKNEHNTELHSWWIKAPQSSQKTAVILHGWSANKSLMLPLAESFHKNHYNVFLLDAHNHGKSEKNGAATMPKFADDLQAAIQWVKKHKPDESKFIIATGHSVGAAATLLTAARNTTQANQFIAISSFAHPKLMMQRQLQKLKKIPGLVNLISNYIQWIIGYKFDDIAPVTSLKRVNQQTQPKPILLIHGTADQLIPLSDHEMLCEQQSASIECLQIEGADHDSIDKIDENFNKVLAFIERHQE